MQLGSQEAIESKDATDAKRSSNTVPNSYSKNLHYCSSCGTRHQPQELTLNQLGALICKKTHKKVRTKRAYDPGERKHA
jgi:hypothetical protein